MMTATRVVLCAALTFLVLSFNVSYSDDSTGVIVNVTGVRYDVPVKGKMKVTAEAISRKNLSNSQIKQAAINALNSLRKDYPSCESFQVWLSDDRRMLDSGNYTARISYKEGRTEIKGGLPTDKDVTELRRGGIPIIKPTNQGIQIFYEFQKIKIAYHKSGKYMSDEEIYPILSKKMSLPISVIRKNHKGVGWHYMYKENSPL